MNGASFVRCFADGELDFAKLCALRRDEDEMLQSSIKAAAVKAPVDVKSFCLFFATGIVTSLC